MYHARFRDEGDTPLLYATYSRAGGTQLQNDARPVTSVASVSAPLGDEGVDHIGRAGVRLEQAYDLPGVLDLEPDELLDRPSLPPHSRAGSWGRRSRGSGCRGPAPRTCR
jgi:hypothetical protein